MTPDTRWMSRALELAEQGRCSTHPNPRVGCVIVKAGRVVGEGWHLRAGEPHAEINALQAAGKAARGADVYLPLEPCAHHGRTPPCADALVQAGVRRVVVAMQDPDPRVAGAGLARLREAGIVVECGLMAAEAQALNRGFVARITRGRPWLTLKLGASLDGRSAMASGESQWITSAAAREDAHRWRAEAGSVMTGAGTVLADDPQLTARLDGVRQPDRVVLDTRLRTDPRARVWADGARRFAFAVRPRTDSVQALRARGVDVRLVGADALGHVDAAAVLRDLAAAEVNAVLAECGPQLGGALLQAGLVDEVLLYLAPCLLGDGARPLAHLPGLTRLDDRIRLNIVDVRSVDPDLRIVATVMTEN